MGEPAADGSCAQPLAHTTRACLCCAPLTQLHLHRIAILTPCPDRAPVHFFLGTGGVCRHIMKQLEEVGLMEKHPEGGRRLTSNGQRDMDQIAGRITVSLQTFY